MNDFNQANLKSIIAIALKQTKNKNWTCFYPSCRQKTIKSHSQSVSSSLRNIAQDGFVIERNSNAFQKKPFNKWKKIGVNKATIFPGFCSKHDTILFRQVDSINEKNIQSQALSFLFFRTFAMEMRKKEYESHFINQVLKQDEVYLHDTAYEYIYMGMQNCLKVTKPFYLSKFNSLFNSSNKQHIYNKIFKFEENLGISCSTLINPIPTFEQPFDKPQPMISFNILPRKSYTLVVLSSFDEDSEMMNSFINENNRLEDLVFNYSEEVILSIKLFETFSDNLIQTIDEAQMPWLMWQSKTVPDIFSVSLDAKNILLT